jgi:hypothetical protein
MENPMRKALFFLFLFLAALAAITAPQIAAIRTLKTQVMLMENVIADLKTRISLREIPKIHCNTATILVNGGDITVKSDPE